MFDDEYKYITNIINEVESVKASLDATIPITQKMSISDIDTAYCYLQKLEKRLNTVLSELETSEEMVKRLTELVKE